MRSTVVLTVVLILSIGFNVGSTADSLAKEYGDLVFATILFRHGDRAITGPSYPKDPYVNASYWPMGYGQLTNQGKERHYEFGQWLRNRYANFLPEEYSPNDIYIRSTSVDRAIMSGAANLAGLYRPNKNQQWNDNVGKLWQPIPIHSVQRIMDTALSFGDNCPRFKKEFNDLLNNRDIQQFNDNHKDVYKYIKENSGMNLTDLIYDSSSLYDILLVETQFNYTLPNWTHTIFPGKLEEIAKMSFKLPTYTPILKKLSSGVLINDIVEHMERKQSGKMDPDVKLWIYSAHDTNVASLLNSLNIYNNQLPPYAAAVILELRKNIKGNNTFVITVSYRNTSTHEPFLLQIPGCDSLACDWEQFIKVVNPLVVKSWYKECHNMSEKNYTTYFGIITIFLVAVSVIFLTFNKKIFLCYCGRNYEKLYHALPREETETVDLDHDGRSRVAVSFRMNGVETTSADV